MKRHSHEHDSGSEDESDEHAVAHPFVPVTTILEKCANSDPGFLEVPDEQNGPNVGASTFLVSADTQTL